MLRIYKVIILAVISIALNACGTYEVLDEGGKSMMNSKGVYTLTNLHPDPKRSRLYAVNYQQPSLIPLCTEVTLLAASKKVMKFTTNNTGQKYAYYYHKSAGEPLMDHLKQYFGRKCNSEKVKGMSKVDQDGIAKGIPINGMTRDGVILAMGYPPRHKTPSLDVDTWIYWKSRFGTMKVIFKDGKVSQIIR